MRKPTSLALNHATRVTASHIRRQYFKYRIWKSIRILQSSSGRVSSITLLNIWFNPWTATAPPMIAMTWFPRSRPRKVLIWKSINRSLEILSHFRRCLTSTCLTVCVVVMRRRTKTPQTRTSEFNHSVEIHPCQILLICFSD